jgi:hypothetical protein
LHELDEIHELDTPITRIIRITRIRVVLVEDALEKVTSFGWILSHELSSFGLSRLNDQASHSAGAWIL